MTDALPHPARPPHAAIVRRPLTACRSCYNWAGDDDNPGQCPGVRSKPPPCWEPRDDRPQHPEPTLGDPVP